MTTIDRADFDKSLNHAHATLREHRDSIDSLYKLVNDNAIEIREMRSAQSSLLMRMDKIDGVLNDSHRMINEIGASLRSVDREQQIMMVNLTKTEMTTRDTYEKVSKHILDENQQYSTLHKKMIRVSAGIVGLVVIGHALLSMLLPGGVPEGLTKLLEFATGG